MLFAAYYYDITITHTHTPRFIAAMLRGSASHSRCRHTHALLRHAIYIQ